MSQKKFVFYITVAKLKDYFISLPLASDYFISEQELFLNFLRQKDKNVIETGCICTQPKKR